MAWKWLTAVWGFFSASFSLSFTPTELCVCGCVWAAALQKESLMLGAPFSASCSYPVQTRGTHYILLTSKNYFNVIVIKNLFHCANMSTLYSDKCCEWMTFWSSVHLFPFLTVISQFYGHIRCRTVTAFGQTMTTFTKQLNKNEPSCLHDIWNSKTLWLTFRLVIQRDAKTIE